METRADCIVVASPADVNKPFATMNAWKNSSLVLLYFPNCVWDEVKVKVGDPSTGAYQESISGVLHPVRGFWYFYIPRNRFKNGGRSAYKIIATDERGSRHVCGEGVLRVHTGMIHDAADNAGSSDAMGTAFVYGYDKWWRIGATIDDAGAMAFTVTEDLADHGDTSQTPYAYNPLTGLFHSVSVFKDGAGVVSLEISDDGIEEASVSFALNPETNLYHRMECETDEAGAVALIVGDKQ